MRKSALAIALAATATVAWASTARAETIYGLTTENSIVVIDSAAPEVSLDGGTVRGVEDGEKLVALDYRASNGQLYAVGNFNNLYETSDDGRSNTDGLIRMAMNLGHDKKTSSALTPFFDLWHTGCNNSLPRG